MLEKRINRVRLPASPPFISLFPQYTLVCCFVLGFFTVGVNLADAQPTESVLVIPFTNLTGRSANGWIGDGIADSIVLDLEKLGLSVSVSTEGDRTGPTGAAGGRLIDRAIVSAGQAANVSWVVTGAYQHAGELLRITTQLVDVRAGRIRKRAKIDGALLDLFRLQDAIVAELAEILIQVDRPEAPVEPLSPPQAEGAAMAEEADPTPSGLSGLGPVPSEVPSETLSSAAVPILGERAQTTIGRTATPPQIDGRLDDAVWQTATHLTEFTQITPVEGAPGTDHTELWMAYDDDRLYFAFYAHYRDTSIIRINRADRDDIRGDDQMTVLFDPFLDQQRAYQFEVNGFGVQADSLVNADGSTGSRGGSMSSGSGSRGTSSRRSSGMMRSGSFGIIGDDSWNALFETAGQVVEDGWTAEMAIPFKSLRYPNRPTGEPHQWGFQVTRRIRGKSEAQTWAPVSRAIAGQITQFGILNGLENLSQSRNLEFLPELYGISFGSLDGDTGRFTQRDPVGSLGVGVKYGITPNLVADLTYNPDFSQVQSDQPQVETNQRFALFYPEQRPFFLEGQEIFQMATPLNLLNTRTVVDPRFGGKLTGKVGNTTLGFLVADDEAAGRFDDRTNSRFGDTAQTLVGRARYDFYSESYLGAVMTAREFGFEHNRVGGIDGRFRLGQTHRLSFMGIGSSTQHETDGALGGPAVEADLTHQGRHLGYGLAYTSIDPEFRTDSGFLPRFDLKQTAVDVSYRFWPESTLMTWGPTLTYLRLYDHAGTLQNEQLQSETSFQFRNNISFNGTVSRNLERYRSVDFQQTGYGLYGVISARKLSIFGGFNGGDGILFSDNPYLGRSTAVNANASLRLTSRWATRITAISSRFVNPIGNTEVFNVKIFRTRTTYQFTERFLLRHIMEHNTLSMKVGNNLLLTYRINAGTMAFLGYDDRFQRGTRIDNMMFPTTALLRTNRAVFAKVAYLFRY